MFALTEAGALVIEPLIDGLANRPHWDSATRQLRVGDVVIKEFHQPAENQVTLLTAFEEEGWPPRIDDPLPPSGGIDPKERLHEAIRRLNQHQITPKIRFAGDGTGRGVLWRLLDS
jgi:hypothetical protein